MQEENAEEENEGGETENNYEGGEGEDQPDEQHESEDKREQVEDIEQAENAEQNEDYANRDYEEEQLRDENQEEGEQRQDELYEEQPEVNLEDFENVDNNERGEDTIQDEEIEQKIEDDVPENFEQNNDEALNENLEEERNYEDLPDELDEQKEDLEESVISVKKGNDLDQSSEEDPIDLDSEEQVKLEVEALHLEALENKDSIEQFKYMMDKLKLLSTVTLEEEEVDQFELLQTIETELIRITDPDYQPPENRQKDQSVGDNEGEGNFILNQNLEEQNEERSEPQGENYENESNGSPVRFINEGEEEEVNDEEQNEEEQSEEEEKPVQGKQLFYNYILGKKKITKEEDEESEQAEGEDEQAENEGEQEKDEDEVENADKNSQQQEDQEEVESEEDLLKRQIKEKAEEVSLLQKELDKLKDDSKFSLVNSLLENVKSFDEFKKLLEELQEAYEFRIRDLQEKMKFVAYKIPIIIREAKGNKKTYEELNAIKKAKMKKIDILRNKRETNMLKSIQNKK